MTVLIEYELAVPLFKAIQMEMAEAQNNRNRTTKLIQQEPNNASLYFSRGAAQFKLSELQAALQDFNQAIQLNSQDADFYYLRGYTRYRLNDKPGAIKDFTEAIRLQPELGDAYVARALVQYDTGNKQEALKDATQAVNINAEEYNAKLIHDLVSAELQNQEFTRASLGVCLYGCGSGPSLGGNPNAFYRGATARSRRGDWTGARSQLSRAEALYKRNGDQAGSVRVQSCRGRVQRRQSC